jgi:hypothetical protein
MFGQDYGYHVGYETTKAYQAELRSARMQDRLAVRALGGRQAGAPWRLAALLRDERLRRWMVKLPLAYGDRPPATGRAPTPLREE